MIRLAKEDQAKHGNGVLGRLQFGVGAEFVSRPPEALFQFGGVGWHVARTKKSACLTGSVHGQWCRGQRGLAIISRSVRGNLKLLFSRAERRVYCFLEWVYSSRNRGYPHRQHKPDADLGFGDRHPVSETSGLSTQTTEKHAVSGLMGNLPTNSKSLTQPLIAGSALFPSSRLRNRNRIVETILGL